LAIDLLKRKGLALFKLRPGNRHLLSVGGVGTGLGLTIRLETGPVERFALVGHCVSYRRCIGTEHWSNVKHNGRGNTKSGNRYLA